MPLVPPGSETGLYYIILAGLPWEATWQNVRNELRAMPKPCKVDHVEVFKGTGNGWVRVIGEEDAIRAHDYLNGHYMMGVHLISHFKNRYDPVMLRGRISEGPDDHATQRHYRPSVREPPVPPVGYVQHRIESHSMYSETQQLPPQPEADFIPQSPPFPLQPRLSARTVYNVAYTQPQAVGSQFAYANIPQQVIAPPYASLPPPLSIPLHQVVQPAAKISLTRPPESPSFVNLAARKIIIKNLPRKTKLETITQVLQDSIAPEESPPNAIQALDIPLHSNGQRRGHAIALLATETMAIRACEVLDGMMLEGRSLRVSLTKEGVAIPGSSTFEASMEEHGSSMKDSEGVRSSPLVVNGSIRGDKAGKDIQRSKGKGKEKEKEKRKR